MNCATKVEYSLEAVVTMQGQAFFLVIADGRVRLSLRELTPAARLDQNQVCALRSFRWNETNSLSTGLDATFGGKARVHAALSQSGLHQAARSLQENTRSSSNSPCSGLELRPCMTTSTHSMGLSSVLACAQQQRTFTF
jgi:hypothetical protein